MKGICAIKTLLSNLQRLNLHNLRVRSTKVYNFVLVKKNLSLLAVEPVEEPAPSMTLIVTIAFVIVVLIITPIIVVYCYRRHKHMFNEVRKGKHAVFFCYIRLLIFF